VYSDGKMLPPPWFSYEVCSIGGLMQAFLQSYHNLYHCGHYAQIDCYGHEQWQQRIASNAAQSDQEKNRQNGNRHFPSPDAQQAAFASDIIDRSSGR